MNIKISQNYQGRRERRIDRRKFRNHIRMRIDRKKGNIIYPDSDCTDEITMREKRNLGKGKKRATKIAAPSCLYLLSSRKQAKPGTLNIEKGNEYG